MLLKKQCLKKIFFLLFYCILFTKVSAQYPQVRESIINLPNFDKKNLHYGYFVGFNSYDFKFEYEENYYEDQIPDIITTSKTGFNVGLIGDLRINNHFNLRIEPGLYYSQRDLYYPNLPDFDSETDRFREVKSTYIHIPLIVKINAQRINNFRPFILGGISTDFNLSSNKKNSDDNFSNVFRTTSSNVNYELGFGFDFYLTYFKFSPSVRGIFSIENELIPDSSPTSPWTGNVINMFSRGVAINFTFE